MPFAVVNAVAHSQLQDNFYMHMPPHTYHDLFRAFHPPPPPVSFLEGLIS